MLPANDVPNFQQETLESDQVSPGVTSWLQLQYAARRVRKCYWALVAASAETPTELVPQAQGLIEARLAATIGLATGAVHL